LLLSVTNAAATLTTTYKAFALVNADSTKATLRYLNGTTDASLAEFPIDFTFRLQGTITYASPNIANNQPLPTTALPGKFVADQNGRVAFNTGLTAGARFDVKEDSATFPTLKVTQAGTGDILQVVDGLTSALVVKDGGNVGIGTTNPLQKLHVVGNTRIQGDAVVTGNWEVLGTTTYIDTYTAVTSNVTINNASGNGPALRVTQSGVGANYPIADFYDSDVSTTVPALRIADGGNVGIGTTDPLQKLHVIGNARVDGNATLGYSVTADAHTVSGSVGVTYSGTSAALTVNQQGTGKLFEVQDGGVARVTVLDGGNVGIGTTNPLQKLHVQGNILASGSLTSGDAVVNGHLIAPQITGPQNAGVYVPQDFSSSALNIPAYVVGSVPGSSMGPFAGEGSMYFNGIISNYLSFGTQLPVWSSSAVQDGTIEFWIHTISYPSFGYIVQRAVSLSSSTYDWQVYMGNTGAIFLGVYNSGRANNYIAAAPQLVALNTWTHVAATIRSSVMTVFVNGSAGTPVTIAVNGIVNYSTTSTTFIGNGQMNAYIANLRMVQGTALYTTSFTPPTAPLQPIQGITQAGTPYGTVLLLRNAPAPGRVLTQKFAGANSSSVLAFPPGPMTGYSTTINAGYGEGTYVASASTEQSPYISWRAFDKTNTTVWVSGASKYNSTSPFGALNAATTVDVNGNSYMGEWLQLQLPSSIVLSSYVLRSDQNSNFCSVWYILGSLDGIKWYIVNQQSIAPASVGFNIAYTFDVASCQAFNYYRLVATAVSGSYGGNIGIVEWSLNGTIDSINISADGRVGFGVVAPVQALEVAGSAVVTGTVSSGTGLMFRNRIINGDMRIDQRNGGASVTNAVNDTWLLDRFVTVCRLASKLSFQQSSNVPPGFTYSLLVTSLSAYTPVTSDFYGFCQRIEGYNIADLNWGTPNALPITISFWIRSSVSGNYVLNIQNAYTRSYAVTYTISGVNAWQYVKLTIPGDITGTWNTTNGMGMRVWFDLGSSDTSYAVTTPGVWQAGDKVRVSGATNFVSTNGATLYVTGIQLEKGMIATPFEFRPFAIELQLCLRYCIVLGGQMPYNYFGIGISPNTTNVYINCSLPMPMRSPVNSTVAAYNIGSLILYGNVGTASSPVYGGNVVTSVGKDQHNKNNIILFVGVASGLVPLATYNLITNNSYTPLIEINNEL